MGKSIGAAGINLIKQFEGCRLTAYQDSVGVWTIGYGTTNADKSITGIAIQRGLTITQETADAWLAKSINQKYAVNVNKYDSIYSWNQNEFDALCSFAYNIGSIDTLCDKGKRTKAIIAEKMLLYNKAKIGDKLTELAGLTRRRNAERELFLTPCTDVKTQAVAATTATNAAATTSKTESGVDYNMKTIKNGSKGTAVKIWQVIIGVTVDGIFGAKTESTTKTWQKKHNLTVDGIVGKNSWKAGLESA